MDITFHHVTSSQPVMTLEKTPKDSLTPTNEADALDEKDEWPPSTVSTSPYHLVIGEIVKPHKGEF